MNPEGFAIPNAPVAWSMSPEVQPASTRTVWPAGFTVVDPAVFNGFPEVAEVSPTPHQLVAEFDTLSAQLVALHKDPVVVHPRQQIAAIFLDRRYSMIQHRGLVPGRERPQRQLSPPAEHAHVDAARWPLSPHQCGGFDDERLVIAEQHTKIVQLSSQIRTRLLLRRFRPENGGQALPRLRCLRVHSKEAEQSDGARGACEVRRGRSFDVLLPEK